MRVRGYVSRRNDLDRYATRWCAESRFFSCFATVVCAFGAIGDVFDFAFFERCAPNLRLMENASPFPLAVFSAKRRARKKLPTGGSFERTKMF